MPAPKWATPEQLAFLIAEDQKWLTIKAGTTSLKSFYVRTANTFLEKWPEAAIPDKSLLKKAGDNAEKGKELAEDRLHDVSVDSPSLGCLSPFDVARCELVQQSPPP